MTLFCRSRKYENVFIYHHNFFNFRTNYFYMIPDSAKKAQA